jgi:hypothetical protein
MDCFASLAMTGGTIDVFDNVLYGPPVLPSQVKPKNDVSGNAAKTDPNRNLLDDAQ